MSAKLGQDISRQADAFYKAVEARLVRLSSAEAKFEGHTSNVAGITTAYLTLTFGGSDVGRNPSFVVEYANRKGAPGYHLYAGRELAEEHTPYLKAPNRSDTTDWMPNAPMAASTMVSGERVKALFEKVFQGMSTELANTLAGATIGGV